LTDLTRCAAWATDKNLKASRPEFRKAKKEGRAVPHGSSLSKEGRLGLWL
jgi:hypothetical protein